MAKTMGRTSRRTLAVLGAVALLGLGVWLGAQGAWRLYAGAARQGCVPLFPDVTTLDIRPAEPGHVRFAALGDTGTGSDGARRVASALSAVCARDGCDFVALLGDNFYPDGVSGPDDPLFDSAFESVYAHLTVPVVPVLGNHDVHRSVTPQVFHTRDSARWRMPNFEYAFRAGPARFFAINTNCQPVTWWRLEDRLDASDAERASGAAGSARPWTFVLGHHALYGTGPHGDASWAVRWFWDDVEPRVDYYLAGHNHMLEHLERPGEETEYVVSGSGGAAEGDPARAHPDTAAQSRFARYTPGFAWFDVTADAVSFRFYDDTGKVLYVHTRRRR